MASGKLKRGKRLTTTGKWKIVSTKGTKRVFAGTLLSTFNFGAKRIAIFSVPKGSKI